MIKDVRKSEIDWHDSSFRFGKKSLHGELVESIKKYGILDRPQLLEGEKGYRIFSGFNRLETAAAFGDTFSVEIIPRLTEELFEKEVGKKVFHERIGPVGRICVCEIYLQYFSESPPATINIGKKVPGLPVDFYPGTPDYEKLTALPGAFRDYCDDRDISYKIIKGLLSLSSLVREIVVERITGLQPGKNNFRKLIELAADIEQLLGEESFSRRMNDIVTVGDGASFENLYDSLFRIRYPEFSRMDEVKKNILKRINKSSVVLELPDYFEGDEIRISARIRKGQSIDAVLDEIAGIDRNLLLELMELL